MSKVVMDISMSLDGFVTAANVRAEEPMGDGGQIVPALFGSGTRLFDNLGSGHIQLEITEVIETPAAIHLRFRVVKGR